MRENIIEISTAILLIGLISYGSGNAQINISVSDTSQRKVLKNAIFNFEQDGKWETVNPLVKRKIVAYSDDLMLVKVAFETGGIGSLHQHKHLQITYVESGQFEVEVNGEKRILNAGDVFNVPTNIFHGVKCLKKGVFIDVFNPMREDFIKK